MDCKRLRVVLRRDRHELLEARQGTYVRPVVQALAVHDHNLLGYGPAEPRRGLLHACSLKLLPSDVAIDDLALAPAPAPHTPEAAACQPYVLQVDRTTLLV